MLTRIVVRFKKANRSLAPNSNNRLQLDTVLVWISGDRFTEPREFSGRFFFKG